ncbi:4-hydroxy-tetrahydrodipicolinate reductase [Gammaproteobacteria bacterium AB-CW1]|uniref:4-hydroxy-tetrahydrodipicolinate reductase n=1 Tax=Natronospira elongata TaxID=3110268 RepID=A0AAP6MK51_9GAMM|nr:4-hydroxy-tetrahydrodipicolinate reductase [Gammaproteobacteria bacterium AB-CW1]
MLNIAIVGASGRMGRSITALAAEAHDVRISGALVRPGSPAEGTRVLGVERVNYSSELSLALEDAHVVLDFSAPASGERVAAYCAEQGLPLLVGTTGLAPSQRAPLEAAAAKTAVLLAPNTSLGVNLLLELVRRTAAALGEEYDIEIFEAHHGQKVDAPSGTALRLGEEAAAGREQQLDSTAVYQRKGQTGHRRAGDIGFSVMRGGDIAGEHTVYFAGPGERLELTHRASSRDTFARGALNAARWLLGQRPGLYGMEHVLGVSRPTD